MSVNTLSINKKLFVKRKKILFTESNGRADKICRSELSTRTIVPLAPGQDEFSSELKCDSNEKWP